MNSSALGFNLMSLLQNAFAGRFSPRQEDGLAKLAVGQTSRNGNPMYGSAFGGLSGPDLVRHWASMDRNPQGRELADMHPGSPYGQWYQAVTGGNRGFLGGAAYQAALGGKGLGQNNSSWWNPNPGSNSIFRGIMF